MFLLLWLEYNKKESTALIQQMNSIIGRVKHQNVTEDISTDSPGTELRPLTFVGVLV